MTARKLTTLEDYLVAFEGTRNEFIAGQVIEASPTSSDHGDAQIGIAAILDPLYKRKKGGPGEPPGGWWLRTEATVRYGRSHLFAHDLAGWRRELHKSKPTGYPVTERPDWVCEITSTNFRDDKFRKQKVLHEWHVPFYWLVDPVGHEIRILRWDDADYSIVCDVNATFIGILPPFDALPIAVKDLFGIEDED